MFHVTLVNLAPDGASATEGTGAVEIGQLSAQELTALLDTFVELDPVQNMKADPEIRVQTRRERHVIRTGQKKLFLYDLRRPSEPAYVLTASEIIAELDGSAAARRTAPPVSFAPFATTQPVSESSATREDTAPPFDGPRPWPFTLIGITILLAGYLVYAEFFVSSESGNPTLTPLATSERLTEDSVLTAVYLTGNEPGKHGIVILGDGKLKLFRIHAAAAPGVVYGTYQLGRLDGKLRLATDQPGGLITVVDRDTLEYCGETYRRVP